MGRPERPLERDGTAIREFAYWLRDLRTCSGLTYEQLARRTNFSTSTLQEATAGRRLPTNHVTRALVAACGGDVDAWELYWTQIRRFVDRDAPADVASVAPPWAPAVAEQRVAKAAANTSDPVSAEFISSRIRNPRRRVAWLWSMSGAVVLLGTGVALGVFLTGNGGSVTFPPPTLHPSGPGTRAAAQTYTEQEFNPNGAPTFLYLDASGAGVPVAYGQIVQVSCKVYSTVVRSALPDGYWYRLVSMPWDNNYYAVANTFGNGDKMGGPYTHNTDWKVPNC